MLTLESARTLVRDRYFTEFESCIGRPLCFAEGCDQRLDCGFYLVAKVEPNAPNLSIEEKSFRVGFLVDSVDGTTEMAHPLDWIIAVPEFEQASAERRKKQQEQA